MTARPAAGPAGAPCSEEFLPGAGRYRLFGRLHVADPDAPTILLLHGLGFHSFEYGPLMPLLVAFGWNCLAFDFRSHGRSEGPRGRWILRDLVDDTESAVTFLSQRLPGPIGAFGNSLGALVALHTAARDRRIRSIVASGCPARVRDFAVTPFRDRLLGALTAVDRVLPIRVSVNHFIPYRKILRTSRAIEQVRRDPLVKDARRFTPSTYADMFKWDALGVVREVRVPLLVLCATRDDFQPPEQSELLLEAARGHAELRTLDTGHLPAFEEPERVAPILHQWFGRTLRPPASDSPLPAGATDPDSSVAEDQSESSRLEDL